MLPWLDSDIIEFPPVEQALDDPDGLLAAGGALTPAWLTEAYSQGIFPWFSDGQPILWWSPTPRTVLFPSEFRLRRSLAKRIRNSGFEVRINTAFNQVIDACAASRNDNEGTWITDEMRLAYKQLHTLGIAASIETWDGDRLVGGLYGIALGTCFFGESMFSLKPDASKIALAYLTQEGQTHGLELIDCQMHTAHLASLGARQIARPEFLRYLDSCTPSKRPACWLSTLATASQQQ
ncbi:leucyl/phenylalanyl-tRNA--protein transferase [Larsenimonas salina]|uniref:leucyl/phenylalanyl-tRNA--protein transferase n=1 Tax=Larsenimonas salina TaxID=1295565 RepID=UPI0020735670|nr:leucyl/phenylalanyl-tRNA--protein transferase [Larsenimonas salina]MCM5704767.1 leucyl/phenylalanyl-tRNA--protein transferase [Larsenimonas salina]